MAATGKPIVVTKALSLIQPWGWAVARGHKAVENRSWSTNYRGTIAIHASSVNSAARWPMFFEDMVTAINPAIFAEMDDRRITKQNQLFHFGAILGIADIVGVIQLPAATEPGKNDFAKICAHQFPDFLRSHPTAPKWAEGEFCWLLANPIQFAVPIPAKGALSLWNLPPDLIVKVAAAVRNGPHGSPVEFNAKILEAKKAAQKAQGQAQGKTARK